MPLTRPRILAALGALTTAAAAATVATAAPATAAPASPAPRPVAVTAAGVLADGSGVAGYVAALPDATRRVSASSFTVPAVTCPGRNVEPLFLGSSLSGTVSRADTTFTYAAGDVVVTCTEGVPFYEASVAIGSDRQTGAVSPGDVLRVEIVVTRTGSSVVMTDRTSGGVFRISGPGFRVRNFQNSVQGGFGENRFPRFGTVRFAGMTVDNRSLASWDPFSFDQVTAGGKVVLETSELTADRAFSIRFRAQP